MDYNHITIFFEKFKKIIIQKKEIEDIIIKSISKSISFPIESNFIKINKGNVFIKTSPLLKNEILINKENILKNIKKELPEGFNIIDIK